MSTGILSSSDAETEEPFAGLLARARAGTAVGWEELVELCQDYLLAMARRKMPAELRAKLGASDVVQETLLEAHRGLDSFQGQTRQELLGWLRQMVRNNLADAERRYRRIKRRADREVPIDAVGDGTAAWDLPDRGPAPSAIYRNREEAERLARALDDLEEHHRTVLELRHRDGLSFAEIATRMQRTPNAARKLWIRALGRLQQVLIGRG